MIKRLIFGLCLCFFASWAIAQDEPMDEEFDMSGTYLLNERVYSLAMRYNDMETAKKALYDLIILDSQNDSLLLNLSYLYLEGFQNYVSALFVAQDIIQLNPNNEAAYDIAATCYENLGVRDKALDMYENLYLKNNSIEILYKMAFLQYELERYEEAKTSANIILDKPASEEITYFFKGRKEGEQEEIKMRAAIYNLLGMIEREQGNMDEAKANFLKALEINNQFTLAQKNLNEIR